MKAQLRIEWTGWSKRVDRTRENKAHADAFFSPSPGKLFDSDFGQKADLISHISTLQYDYSGRSKGEATMEFASYQQAKIAINKFDGAMTRGTFYLIHLSNV